ncbi:MAG: hypothetical protein WD002_03875 [Pseudomonadales bacterium]
MVSPQDVRLAYLELRNILAIDDLLTDQDPLWLRFAELGIELDALEITELRKTPMDPDWHIVTIKSHLILEQVATLAIDVLGYFALPDEPPGSNEPAIGNRYASLLASNYFNVIASDEVERMRLRDAVADFLLQLQSTTDQGRK